MGEVEADWDDGDTLEDNFIYTGNREYRCTALLDGRCVICRDEGPCDEKYAQNCPFYEPDKNRKWHPDNKAEQRKRKFSSPEPLWTDECHFIQANGFKACLDCKLKGTDKCDGKDIIISGKNRNGHDVPLEEEAEKASGQQIENYKKQFVKKEPIVGSEWEKDGFIADNEQIDKQPCSNRRCRGNVSYRCVYHSGQYDICGDKGAVNNEFFMCD